MDQEIGVPGRPSLASFGLLDKTADQVLGWSEQLHNTLNGMNVQATFIIQLQLVDHVLYSYSCRGQKSVDKDVLQLPKSRCKCQRRDHIPEKAYLDNTATQTTNQAATRVQSPTTLAE